MDGNTAQTVVQWAHIWSVPKKEVKVGRIRRHRAVISEWSQGEGHLNRLGEAEAAGRTCRLTTQWWSDGSYRHHVGPNCGPTKFPSHWYSLIKIRKHDYYEVYCTQWNLEFTLPESTFSLTLCTCLLVLPKCPQEQCEMFLSHILVLPTKLLNCVFQLSMNWHVAVILSTFNWKSGRQADFCNNFLNPPVLSCTVE
jgi:hypothetical protein